MLLWLLFSADSLNVRLLATWSDGDPETGGRDVVAKEGCVYLAFSGDGSGGLVVLDARNPFHGIQVIRYLDTVVCGGVALWQQYLIAARLIGLCVYDITNPQLPVLIGVAPWPPHVVGLNLPLQTKQTVRLKILPCYQDTLLVMVDKGTGVHFYDFSDPTNPEYLCTWQPPIEWPVVYDAAFLPPHYLYVNSDSLYVLDISDPANPTIVGTGDCDYTLQGALAIWYPYLFVGGGWGGRCMT